MGSTCLVNASCLHHPHNHIVWRENALRCLLCGRSAFSLLRKFSSDPHERLLPGRSEGGKCRIVKSSARRHHDDLTIANSACHAHNILDGITILFVRAKNQCDPQRGSSDSISTRRWKISCFPTNLRPARFITGRADERKGPNGQNAIIVRIAAFISSNKTLVISHNWRDCQVADKRLIMFQRLSRTAVSFCQFG